MNSSIKSQAIRITFLVLLITATAALAGCNKKSESMINTETISITNQIYENIHQHSEHSSPYTNEPLTKEPLVIDDSHNNTNYNSSHEHSFGNWIIIRTATCTLNGAQERKCTCGYVETQAIAKTGHKIAVVSGHSAGCETTGLTEGKVCTLCEKLITKQEVIPAIGHTEIIDKEVKATCQKAGLTQGSHCENCGKVLITQAKTEKLAHKVALNATCCQKAKCATCLEYFGDYNYSNHSGGTEIKNATAASCTKSGYSGDKHCKGCGKKLSSGQTLPKLEHDYVKALHPATGSSPEYYAYTCKKCGDIKAGDTSVNVLPITISIIPTNYVYNGENIIDGDFKINASGGSGKLLYKYEVFKDAFSTNPIDNCTEDFSSRTTFGYYIGSGTISGTVLQVTVKDELGNTKVARYTVTD